MTRTLAKSLHKALFLTCCYTRGLVPLGASLKLLLFIRSIIASSLWPHRLQHYRLPCPSLSISQSLLKFMSIGSVMLSNRLIICHLLLLPSVFPSIRNESDGQSIGASASALPMNIQCWFPLGLTCLIFLLSKGLSRVSSRITIWKHQFFDVQPFLWSSSHIHTWLLEKP